MNCRIVFIVMLAVVTTNALTNYEILILLGNGHSTIRDPSKFKIGLKEGDDDVLVVVVTGEPSHYTPSCYNTSLGCCRPDATIRPRTRSFQIPRRPIAGNETYCTPMGPVGVNTGGTLFYNHFEANCVDANRFEEGTFDFCNGHPGPNGEYHFHRAPNPLCVGNPIDKEPHIIGVALDGFAIYDSNVYNGKPQQLDECGGFMPNGNPAAYRYVSAYYSNANDTPDGLDHVIPCFKGVPLQPRCCECLECNRVQLPNCTFQRPNGPGGMGRPGSRGGAGRPGNRGETGRPGGQGRRIPGSGPPFGFGGQNRPFRRRPNGGRGQGGFFGRLNRPGGREFGGQFPGGRNPFGENEEQREGFCTRDQIRQQLVNSFLQPLLACDQCPTCVPEGGYPSFEEAMRYLSCRQCVRNNQEVQGGRNTFVVQRDMEPQFRPIVPIKDENNAGGSYIPRLTPEEYIEIYAYLESLDG